MSNLHIKVIGAGPSGSLLALSLVGNSNAVSIYEAKSKEQILLRDRTYAINHSSRRLLQRIGIWDDLNEFMIPFDSLSLEDYSVNQRLVLYNKDLVNLNSSYKEVGWTLDHKLLMEYLFYKISKSSNINIKFSSKDNDANALYDYTFAADGTNSRYRDLWKFKSYRFKYNQECITFKALLRTPFTHRAYEIFRKDGPMAILPMANDLYQIVLSMPPLKSDYLLNLTTSHFLDTVATYLPIGMEIDTLINKPQKFSLSLNVPIKLQDYNRFLIGESLHSLHPVGGQGLNLSIRDIDDIMNLLTSSNLLQYKICRYIDIYTTSFLTHMLIVIFSSNNIILKVFKLSLFTILRKSILFRKIVLSLMTDGIPHIFK
ncbi:MULTISPECIES: FAD-dependent monooxygenase [Prochlorococcus]|uniref:2-polyprenyl-6-methoxyphenol hydroxylase related enzyme n=1 Tax=Prochlorococcus marinus (strain SARG / CCMP1375 / SS120) TaxID=167539 RepID=Q7VC36_PROMA|nr:MULTISPECIES: FAD-dependent monooxygenase [Prochlorococcus]AAP99950.1 2-polyprenyl-6-methoxyphenol hydroxylase related enzyme [Prochlorococcus marinus subsp. marinus str. CCMP1375]KGG11705.1 2-octaprenyl-6-methoxyphenol hydroxylase [Prochlorococcus marinus str. LG]KGG18882.1 2-octaprenyl-6-methoxyphenol hydroxylase [Prochlorococcus marinus str. SS2]KGG23580.1 2-octaprenyl-6-methoxyphenol hydroxylase [Prochlorococcus marinus str. SS35]KGG32184.1 2-octaprenyl-6-methoxyphenol hydroxylase [Proc